MSRFSLPLLGWATQDQITQAITDLRRTADRMKDTEWSQDEYRANDGAMCAFGVLCSIYGIVERHGQIFSGTNRVRLFDHPINLAAGVFYRIAGMSVESYNDAGARTKNEMVKKLREVADLAEKQLAAEVARSQVRAGSPQ